MAPSLKPRKHFFKKEKYPIKAKPQELSSQRKNLRLLCSNGMKQMA